MLHLHSEDNECFFDDIAYLFCDCSSTLNELPFGETVSGAELQGSSLLDQTNTAMAQFLHPCPYLESNLKA